MARPARPGCDQRFLSRTMLATLGQIQSPSTRTFFLRVKLRDRRVVRQSSIDLRFSFLIQGVGHVSLSAKRQINRLPFEATTSLLMLVLLAVAGCDEVESIVNDVKSEVGGDSKEAVTPSVSPASESAASPELPPTPAPPDPAQLVTQFRQLKSIQISDAALQRLADVPEAAAQITELDLRGSKDSRSDAGCCCWRSFRTCSR